MKQVEARIVQLQPATGKMIQYGDLSLYCSCISILINPTGTKTPIHCHDFFELLLLLEGKQFISVLGHESINAAGNFTLIPPGVLHSHTDYPGCDQRGVVVRFYAKKSDETYMPVADRILSILSKTHILPLTDQFLIDMLSKPVEEYAPEDAPLDFLRTLFHIADVFQKDANVENSSARLRIVNDRDLVENVIMSITTLYMTDIDVLLLARMHSISYRHLARIFVSITGYTLTEWITYSRIFYGMQYLVETDLPIASIALQTGFRSESYFSSVFTRVVGMPPTAFRRKHAGVPFSPPSLDELPGLRKPPSSNDVYNPMRPHTIDPSRIQYMKQRCNQL